MRIDRTPPTVVFGAPTPAPNAAGWYNGDVTLPFDANDTLSGVAETDPAGTPLKLSAEGSAVTATVVATDRAGNQRSFTSDPFRIDKTKPAIEARVEPPANVYGWNNSDVTVVFTCGDTGSAIACPGPVTLTSEGANQIVSRSATDEAGNSATAEVTINIDKTPPMIAAAPAPPPNADGWNTTPVTVSFSCDDGLSAVDTCPLPVTVTSEGASQPVSGTAIDRAGNRGQASVSVSVDATPPAITATITPPANAAGWNRTDVTVSFTCADAGSGVVKCPDPQTVAGEGAGQTVTADVADRAATTRARRPPSASTRPRPC